ncbi:hypothetical protein GCM10020221_32300 [Streptomyces thioluteus]|uniref:PKS/mFAS DH domain-containing protein n=1 Tax=Streptomyces thioluteus TaxID=66431 RepID=A0ABN3X3W1_STRTU
MLEELTLERPLVLAEGASVVRCRCRWEHRTARADAWWPCIRATGDADAEWARHAAGVLTAGSTGSAESLEGQWPPAGAQPVEITDAYEQLAAVGYGYGPVFQGLHTVWRAGEELFAEVRVAGEADAFGVHPALLDAALHALLSDDLWVPFSWTRLCGCTRRRLGAEGPAVAARRRLRPAGGVRRCRAAVVTVEELRLQRMSRETAGFDGG